MMMTGKDKRRYVSWAEEDRISNLPEHLIDSILERVPFEDAVRTSIMSKKWRYRWTTIKDMIFDEKFYKNYAKNVAFGCNGFIRIITQILILHEGFISKFQLYIPSVNLDSFQEVDQWMILLARKRVKELDITNLSLRYKLPSHVFSCQELRKLKLDNCIFKPPLEFEGFLNLKDLYLRNIDFGDNLSGTQISLPQLKKLSLYMCTNIYNFNIKATKLKSLIVFCCPDALLLRLLHSPCLCQVVIYFHKHIEESVPVEKMTMAMMLSNLPKTERLYVNGFCFKVLIAEKIPKWLPHAVNSLKHLFLLDFELGDLDQLHAALCLLRSSPNLESLTVRSLETEPQVIDYDVGPALDHLEAPNCLDCTLSRLETVEIEYLQGSIMELLFTKLLLAHSPSLEELSITPSGSCDVQKRLDISKDVMRFPRASSKVEVIYLNPDP